MKYIINIIIFPIKFITRIIAFLFVVLLIILTLVFTYEIGKNGVVTIRKIKRIRFFYGIKKKLLVNYKWFVDFIGFTKWFERCI